MWKCACGKVYYSQDGYNKHECQRKVVMIKDEKEDVVNKCKVCGKRNFESPYSRIRCLSCYNHDSGINKEKEDIPFKCETHGWYDYRLPCVECENIKEDIINKPNHYHDNGVDPISIGESILTKKEMNGFYKMNMIKYWYRAGKKDNNSKEQDLKKYEFYKKKLEENM